MATPRKRQPVKGASVIDPRLAKALAHPLRVEILAEVNKAPLSPKEFSEQKPDERSLSGAGYHFRELEKFGLIEIVSEVPRRGVIEHYYGPTTRALYGDVDWDALPGSVGNSMNFSILRTLNDQVLEAIEANTFDSHANCHFTWTLSKLDEQGFDRMMVRLKEVYEALRHEEVEADKRIAESGEAAVYTTVALGGFESPAPRRRGKA